MCAASNRASWCDQWMSSGWAASCCSSRARMRWRISVAAASVKVTMSIWSNEARSRNRQSRQRSTRVCVLPVPAPAMTRTFPRATIAACWDLVKLIPVFEFWVNYHRDPPHPGPLPKEREVRFPRWWSDSCWLAQSRFILHSNGFLEHAPGVRPGIDAANGPVVAMVAGGDVAFAVGIDIDVAGVNLPAHID